jgi:hypothetical protein
MAVTINGTTGITTPDVDSTADGSFNGVTVGKGAGSGTSNTVLGVGAGSAMTTGGYNTIIGGFSGNENNLDIRTASNYVVLSDGDGNIQSYYSTPSRVNNIGNLATTKTLPITAGTGVYLGAIENNAGGWSGITSISYIKVFFSVYQEVGSRALRLTFSRAADGSTVQFRLLFGGEYPTDSVVQYLARFASTGSGGGTYSSSNYATGDLSAGSWTNPGGTANYYWQQAGTPIASTGWAFCFLELMVDSSSGPSGLTISYA